MNPMTLEKFLRIKNKYGNHASWAIWADETDAPKSRMDEISFFDDPAIIKSLNNSLYKFLLDYLISSYSINKTSSAGAPRGAS